MGDVVFKLDADQAKAVRGFLKVVDAQKKGERQFRKTTRQAKGQEKALHGVKNVGNELASLFGIGGGIAGGFAAISQTVGSLKRDMEEMARSARQAGNAVTSFALMQPAGTRERRMNIVAQMGAEYGVPAQDAWKAVQSLQAQAGGFEQGLRAARSAWRLKRAGVPAQPAQQAVTIGMGLGMTPQMAARAPYAAGELSALSPAEMAQAAARGLPEWRGLKGGPMLGYAVMSQLSQIFQEPGELGTHTARAASAFSNVDINRRLGLPANANPLNVLRELQDRGVTTTQQLEQFGYTEKRERIALSTLLMNLPDFERRREKMSAIAQREGLLGQVRSEAESELEILRLARQLEETEARTGAARALGPLGKQAAQTELIRRRRYEVLSRMPAGWPWNAIFPGSSKAGMVEWLPGGGEGRITGAEWGFMAGMGPEKANIDDVMLARGGALYPQQTRARLQLRQRMIQQFVDTGGITGEDVSEQTIRGLEDPAEFAEDLPLPAGVRTEALELLRDIRDNTGESTPRNAPGDE
jgi:hypothetical protein